MVDGSPTLSVGFEIDFQDAFGQLRTMEDIVGDVAAKTFQEFKRMEKASAGAINMGSATAQMKAFGNATTREMQSAARATAIAEKAGERLLRQLERQNDTYGKSRSELRMMKAETAALAAEQQGLTDLASKIRATESELAGKELAAARRARFEAEALAEQKADAEARAAIEKAQERVRAEQAVIAQLTERNRLEQALERNTGLGRMSAQDGGATFSALAAKAAEDEARANEQAAAAANKLAREHEELAAAVRASHAAQEADAASAERMRMATDPLYAATKRLNDEIAESTRLYYAGATAPAEYARQQEVLTQRLDNVRHQQDMLNSGIRGMGATSGLAKHHVQNLAFQFQDLGVQMAMAAQSSDPLRMALMALFMQGSQISGVMDQAGMSIGDLAEHVGKITLKWSPFIIAAGGAAFAVNEYKNAINDRAETDEFVASLGLTADELKKLGDTGVTIGDTLLGTWDVIAGGLWDVIGPAVIGTKDSFTDWFWESDQRGRDSINNLIGYFVGGFNAIKGTWSQLPAALSDLFVQSVNAGIRAINALTKASVDSINGFITESNAILGKVGFQLPTLEAGQISEIVNQNAGAAEKVGDVWSEAMEKAKKDYVGSFGDAISEAAIARRNARLKEAADALKEDRSGSKGNSAAERAARDAAATEAQIRNLYALADAYRESGAAALIAEARVKAESKAIKQRGDVEAYVNREVRLAIAQRVTDAAKSTAGMREQADAQRAVNEMVQAGLVPAERAQQLVEDQIADLPLLAALQVAQQRGLATEAEKATQALADQRAERERLRVAEEQTVFNNEMAAGSNRIAMLQEELRLVGATNAERNIALATLEAMQRADAMFTDPAKRAAYIEQQRQIAAEVERVAAAQRDWNDALNFTADKWDLIARNVQNAGAGMAEAFGQAGSALGGLTSIYANYRAEQERADALHKARMEAATTDAAREREMVLHTIETQNAQVGMYGDLASAAQGFFKEKSKGYKAMMAAEKVFRTFELAMSIRSMVQDALETTTSVANSAARATAAGTEGVAEQSKLPFPFNIAAMAATAAALVAAGVTLLGSGGGGGSKTPQTNTGTGTVLGDPAAQSESIKNAINALQDVNTTTSIYAREMAASLRSINNQIGGLASVLVRSGNIDASAGITEGFNKNFIGDMLSKIPLVGNLLGGLFGSKTTILGGGLYGGPQSLAEILSGGFDAQTYTDIKKKKKFFGVTTSTKYKTQYGEVDPALEQQFTMLLQSFNDAILAAAGPLGANTSEIAQRLQNFVLDIGKIDLKDLTGEEIEEKLQAVFGAAADSMAAAAFPGVLRFQQVGEGMFETLVRVASTVEAVTMSMNMLGSSVLSLDQAMGLADQFDNVSELTSAVGAYFEAFYSEEEQVAAKTAQMTKALNSMGLIMPDSLAGFRNLVEAQDLTTEAGRKTYAMLLQMAPAFADLQEAMSGAKSAADIAAERENLQRQIYQLVGNIEAIRALDLAKIDESNKALQQQVWAIQDAQEAAKAAQELRDAWSTVGDSIMDEVARIRGLSGQQTGANFATLMGQFNAATEAARAGDMDAAKDLPSLSQAMLAAAALMARSRQELDRVQADTAASLEETNKAIQAYANGQQTDAQILDAANNTQQANSANDNDNEVLRLSYEEMKSELAAMRADLVNGVTTLVNHAGKTRRILEDVTAASGGDAITTVYGAA